MIPEEEPAPLCCCPSDTVRGFFGKGSSELLLKMALEYSPPMGITCVDSEGQLQPLYMDLIASQDKKETGKGPILGTKGTRELSRLFYYVNYETYSGSSSSGKRKRRVHDNLL